MESTEPRFPERPDGDRRREVGVLCSRFGDKLKKVQVTGGFARPHRVNRVVSECDAGGFVPQTGLTL